MAKKISKKKIDPNKVKSIKVNSNEVPLGVKIISILGFVCTGFMVVLGIMFLLLGIFVAIKPLTEGSLPPDFPAELLPIVTGGMFGLILVVLSFLFFLIAFVAYLVSINLWRLKNWARIFVIVISILSVISALSDIVRGQFGSITDLLLSGVIGAYLLFHEEVKKAFK